MDIHDMILENNAILKVMLRNQVQMITAIEDIMGSLGSKNVSQEHKDLREKMVDVQMRLMEAEVNTVKLTMLRDDAIRRQSANASVDELGNI